MRKSKKSVVLLNFEKTYVGKEWISGSGSVHAMPKILLHLRSNMIIIIRN